MKKIGYSLKIRTYPKGIWRDHISGNTARECKRELAAKLGIAQNKTEGIKMGKNMLTLPSGYLQVKLEKL